LYVVHLFIAYL